MQEDFFKRQNFQNLTSERRQSKAKNFISKEVFVQQIKKKRRLHSNLIMNELKLSGKINQQDLLSRQQKGLKSLQKLRKNSLMAFKNRNSMSQLSMGSFQSEQIFRMSRFAENKKAVSSNLNEIKSNEQDVSQSLESSVIENDIEEPKIKQKISIEQKGLNQTIFHFYTEQNKNSQLSVNRIKKKMNVNASKSNKLLSSINNKIREIDIISKKFDQANSCYSSDFTFDIKVQPSKKEKIFNPLKDFQSKLILRKNMITERKNSLKKNTIVDYRYKAFPKRLKTDFDKQNFQDKYQGLWKQDARLLKNYISGGYTVEKEQYSDFCDLEEYRKLKKNFKTFDQIYTRIKQDKDNPIGKMSRPDKKNPNVLEVVCAIQKQQKVHENPKFNH